MYTHKIYVSLTWQVASLNLVRLLLIKDRANVSKLNLQGTSQPRK